MQKHVVMVAVACENKEWAAMHQKPKPWMGPDNFYDVGQSSRDLRNSISKKVAFQMFIMFSRWVMSFIKSFIKTFMMFNMDVSFKVCYLRYCQGTGHCDHSQSSDQLTNA